METERKFYCEPCNFLASFPCDFNRHCKTKKHAHCTRGKTSALEKNDENIVIEIHNDIENVYNETLPLELNGTRFALVENEYSCFLCEYTTKRHIDYKRHMLSEKHKKNEQLFNDSVFACNICGTIYQTKSGLWKHKEKCKEKIDIGSVSNVIIKAQAQEQPQDANQNVIVEAIQTMTNALLKKDENMKEIIMEVLKNHTQLSGDVYNNTTNNNNTINNNTINNNNMSFNLNFFLNETCKDAVNLSEFIKSIQVSLTDIERVGDVGYVNGISEIIIRKLQELGVERRPIHCTDAKRETIYVKEANKWEKEGRATYLLQFLIDEVQRANLRQLPAWREKHPNCLTSTSQFTDTYNNMSQELMGGDCTKVSMRVKDDRIMRKIAHYAVIDKSMFLSSGPFVK